MATLTKEDLIKGVPVRASTVTDIPGSLATAIEIPTLENGAIATAGTENFFDPSHFNAPTREGIADSDSNGVFVIKPPSGVKHVYIYPFIWGQNNPSDNMEASFRVWFIQMGNFGIVPSGETSTPAFLRGEYRGQFDCVAGSAPLGQGDPIAIKLGNTNASHCDTITPVLDDEAIAPPKVVGGATPNEARHGVVMDAEGPFRIVIQGKGTTPDAKIGFEIRYV